MSFLTYTNLIVIPAQAGISVFVPQNADARFRGHDDYK
jgi:hypothetical protein